MTEQELPQPILKINEQVMINHFITFMIQYISAIQHITNKEQLVDALLIEWKRKFVEAIDVVKKATSQTYAEAQEEDQDVWDIILNASNMGINDTTEEFKEKIKRMIIENLKIVG